MKPIYAEELRIVPVKSRRDPPIAMKITLYGCPENRKSRISAVSQTSESSTFLQNQTLILGNQRTRSA